MQPNSMSAIMAGACAILLTASTISAQTAANVAVVINESSPASVRVGEYYVGKQGIPADNVVRVALPPGEAISRTSYAADIERPIAQAFATGGIQDRILYIVLTKGVPLRITGTAGPKGTAASVDSELTLLYRRMTGRPVPPSGPLDNPYYAGDKRGEIARPFSHTDHDIYLVTRLDALTVDEAISLIDRGMAPASDGAIVLDQRGDARSALADRWISEAAELMKASSPGRPVVLESSAAAATAEEPVFGYFSWGSTDPALRDRSMELRFVAGSIAATLGSGDASTFDPKPGTLRPMAGELLRAGATGLGANVSEPYLQSSFRPQILFPAYLAGLPLADAFYRALPHLSWQSVVIGDPLMRTSGTPLSRTELDPPLDATTGLPAYFSARRLESVGADFPGVAPAALLQLIASETHQGRGDRGRAIEALDKAAEVAPDVAAIHLRLAVLHEEAGNASQAADGYRRVITLQPRNVVALNNLAFTLATRSAKLDEALELAQRARTLAPDSGTVADTLGWIEHLRGNSGEAVKLLREAAKRTPKHAEIRLHAAIALAHAGVHAEAREHLEAALELDASFEGREDVRRLVERLRK